MKAMQLLEAAIVCLAASLHVTSSDCPPEMAVMDFRSEFCLADVVFRARVLPWAHYATAIDKHGNSKWVLSDYRYFRVGKYFKNKTGRRQRLLQVRRVRTSEDLCESKLYGHPFFLVFASGNDSLWIPGCGRVYPWACVPARARRGLSRQRC
ncbi:hypothetical protein BsWGS_19630 [Bradybaena similaris]